MKRHTLIYTVLATLAAIAIVASGAAYAASVFTKTINASVNIVGVAGLSFYSDSGATNPISSLSYGDVAQGATAEASFYVKNTGTVSQTLAAGVSTLPASVGSVSMTFDGLATKTLEVNGVAKVVVSIQAVSGATLGSTSFSISVNGTTPTTTTTTTTTSTTTTATTTTSPPPTTTTIATVSYSATVQPILNTSCVACHSGLYSPRLDSYTAVRAQVTPGDATASKLYWSITGTNGKQVMPPGGSLTSAQIQSIANWINQGALNN